MLQRHSRPRPFLLPSSLTVSPSEFGKALPSEKSTYRFQDCRSLEIIVAIASPWQSGAGACTIPYPGQQHPVFRHAAESIFTVLLLGKPDDGRPLFVAYCVSSILWRLMPAYSATSTMRTSCFANSSSLTFCRQRSAPSHRASQSVLISMQT